MNLKRVFILLLIVSVVISCNMVFASDISSEEVLSQDYSDTIEINSDNGLVGQLEEDNLESIENSMDDVGEGSNECIIYVGTNSTPGGQGTEDDPFPTLDSACNNYNAGEQKDKVTVNVLEGNYTIGSYLIFNTNNLNINASGSVILKNVYDNQKQSFGLSSSGNFTMSNVIVDASNYHPANPEYADNYWFTPFVGDEDNTITFNNCIFTGFEADKQILPNYAHNYNNDWVFNYCKFLSSNGEMFGEFGDFYDGGSVTFNYCVFSAEFKSIALYDCGSVIFDSCWLGHNNGYTSTFFMMASYRPGYYGEIGFDYRVDFVKESLFSNRHAILQVSENYLGDNTYEILGRLIWNDGTDDNIDKLGSMTVYLSADNGNIPSSTTLENGTFNVTYTSDSDYHEIVVVLDGQKIKLNNKINFTLNAPTITYGDNQNITVTFPTNVNGTVYVTVNNNTYHKYVDDQNNVTVPIDDILDKGNYPVQVSFAYDKNEFDVVLHDTSSSYYYTVEEVDSFGFNSTTLSVLGISSSLTASPVTTNYNVTKELVATLTDTNGDVLVNKPVHIVVGTIDETLNTTSDGKVSVDVSGLVPASYVAAISFAGDELYEGFSTSANVIINKVTPKVNISREGDLVKVEVPYATENVTIIVNGDKNTTKLVDNAATYTIKELAQGTYYVTVLYVGDDICDFTSETVSFDVVKSTADLIKELNQTVADKDAKIGELNQTVVEQNKTINMASNPVATNILVKDITTTATTAKYFIISFVDANNAPLVNKTVQFAVNGKTDSVVTNGSGVATVKVSYSTAGTRYYTFSFLGETGYSASIASAKVVVSKKATKLTAPKKTFKATTKTKKVQIKLTTGKKVLKNKKVTLKVKGKTYTAKTNKKGIATFKITKLTKKGTFKYNVKFAGDKAYKAVNKNGKITIK